MGGGEISAKGPGHVVDIFECRTTPSGDDAAAFNVTRHTLRRPSNSCSSSSLTSSSMLGLLARLPAARQHPVPLHPLFIRHFSTPRATSQILKLALPRFSSPQGIVVHCQRRPLSLGSIFGRPKPAPLPTPHVVAHITRLEAEANVQPHDVAKQVALFDALVATKMKSSYELVISRWERMCEFVRKGFFYFLSRSHAWRATGPYITPPRVTRSVQTLSSLPCEHRPESLRILRGAPKG